MQRIHADLLIPGRGAPVQDGVVILDGAQIDYAGPAADALRETAVVGKHGFETALAGPSGARYAVILGDAEVQSGKVSVKSLRREAEQQLLPLAEAINEMR